MNFEPITKKKPLIILILKTAKYRIQRRCKAYMFPMVGNFENSIKVTRFISTHCFGGNSADTGRRICVSTYGSNCRREVRGPR